MLKKLMMLCVAAMLMVSARALNYTTYLPTTNLGVISLPATIKGNISSTVAKKVITFEAYSSGSYWINIYPYKGADTVYRAKIIDGISGLDTYISSSGWLYNFVAGNTYEIEVSSFYCPNESEFLIDISYSSSESIWVRFDGNGGVSSDFSRYYTVGSNYMSLPNAEWNGHSFDGWYTARTGGEKITNMSTVCLGYDILYAHWDYEDLLYLMVVFDANGGMGTMASQLLLNGLASPLKANQFTRSGYEFIGWADSPMGDVLYKDCESVVASIVEVGMSVTLYAKWSPITSEIYTVIFDTNGGDDSFTPLFVLNGANIDSFPTPTRSKYKFLGWYTAKAGGTKVTADTKVSANVTYYARWEILSFKLVLHKNDGTGTSKEISVKYGSPVVLPGAAKTLKWAPRRGFAFMGWATSEKSKNVFLKDQTKVTTSLSSKDTLHVYAIWQLKTASSYAIQYIRNDGSGSVRTIGFNGGVATKLNSVKALGFERRGYTFVGWATSTENARAKKVWKKDMGVVSQPVANGKLLKVYATWKLAPGYYSIRFNKNDGSGKWRELGYKYGENTTLPTIANGLQWSRAGYTFGGWATSAANAAKGIVWRGDKGVTRTPIAAGKTLNVYAIWKKTGATVAAVNRTFEQSTADQTSHASVENALMKLLPGYYSGELADGSGTYNLLVDEGGETGYVQIVFDDASAITETVNVCFLGNVIVVIDEFGMTYNLVK